MTILWASALSVVNLGWLALVVFGLPGTWLMVATTALVAWWKWDQQMFSPWTLAVVVALAVLGEVLEFLAGVAGSRKSGGSWLGAALSLVGGLVGAVIGSAAIPIPVAGTLLGACLGAAGGAFVAEAALGRPMRPALQSGLGAGIGRFVGTLLKLAVGAIIWLIITVAAFWP